MTGNKTTTKQETYNPYEPTPADEVYSDPNGITIVHGPGEEIFIPSGFLPFDELKTAQEANAGDIITREYEGEEYRFRVQCGGNPDPDKNTLIYLGDPEKKPIPQEIYSLIKEHEATIMCWDYSRGEINLYQPL